MELGGDCYLVVRLREASEVLGRGCRVGDASDLELDVEVMVTGNLDVGRERVQDRTVVYYCEPIVHRMRCVLVWMILGVRQI